MNLKRSLAFQHGKRPIYYSNPLPLAQDYKSGLTGCTIPGKSLLVNSACIWDSFDIE
jgi:hypothetical protein